jgi:hypothetical protein
MAFAISVDLLPTAHFSPQRRKGAKKTTQRKAEYENKLPNYRITANVKVIWRHLIRCIFSFFFARPLRLCAFAVKN